MRAGGLPSLQEVAVGFGEPLGISRGADNDLVVHCDRFSASSFRISANISSAGLP
jgi:hypothetical protein